ncbi:hypothetical protein GOP47_0026854 [Adiantum capillus-veneris]|nr:hypothetical protein GOP47_0026854 [Adiantum capillus-veneris]
MIMDRGEKERIPSYVAGGMQGLNKAMVIVGFLILLLNPLTVVVSQKHASTPPRGWNSYDSYSWVISEQEFLRNAELVSQKLLPFGYEYAVVDFLWFRKLEPGASVLSAGFDHIDEWGRPVPDPARWPSSYGGQGLKPIADRLHAMGLKFGIHVMRGISTQAVKDNTPVFGDLSQTWRARDIALQDEACSWMPQCFLHVNESSEGGRLFIQSLYDLYASWEVDFVKHDCVFGSGDFSLDEITSVSQAIVTTGRPIVYSISPGVQANPLMATFVNGFVNMYRVTGDDWDTWHDLQSHFDVARDFAAAGLIGAPGLLGLSWPDLDMLPIGFLTDPGYRIFLNTISSFVTCLLGEFYVLYALAQSVHFACLHNTRSSRLLLEEQRTQMTLWAMARSPLMFGGDMINIDDTTIDILTNQIALEINENSYGNMEVQISDVMQQYTPSVNLLGCRDAAGTYWKLRGDSTAKNYLKLCWTREELTEGGCFHWNPSSADLTARKQKKTATRQIRVGRVLMHENWPSCLDAQVDTQNTFSPCAQRRTQIWHVKPDKKLVNNITKLCAVVNELNYTGSISEQTLSFDTRIWMARGIGGEYYIALFNLQEQSVDVSLPSSGIVEVGLKLPRAMNDTIGNQPRGLSRMDYQCKGKEAWSNQNIETLKGILYATIAPHGCVLFSLQCDLS